MNNELILCDWQYESVRKLIISDFYVGQVVFITCAPRNPFVIINILNDEVTIQCIANRKVVHCVTYLAILPYKYASLMVYKGRFKVCLN